MSVLDVKGREIGGATGGRPIDGDDPPVVLIHGAGLDRTAWQLQTRYLAHHGFRALAIDLPGHGDTPGPALQSIAEMAAWVAEVIDDLGWSPAHVVGHSMGALIGIELAVKFPDVVRSLVLMGVAASMPVHPDLLAAAEAGEDRAGALISGWGLSSDAKLGGHPSPGQWMVGGTQALLATTGAVLGTDLAACDALGAIDERAAEISCPVTLILGRDDRMTPTRAAAPLVEAMPGANVVELRSAGHMMMFEMPGAVRRALVDALGGAPS